MVLLEILYKPSIYRFIMEVDSNKKKEYNLPWQPPMCNVSKLDTTEFKRLSLECREVLPLSEIAEQRA